MRRHNDRATLGRLEKLSHAIINDGAHDYHLQHYYLTPGEQIRQLEEHFSGFRVFARDGHEISSPGELASNEDGYLYYLCNRR